MQPLSLLVFSIWWEMLDKHWYTIILYIAI